MTTHPKPGGKNRAAVVIPEKTLLPTLTSLQQAIVQYVVNYRQKNWRGPTFREMKFALGISSTSEAKRHTDDLILMDVLDCVTDESGKMVIGSLHVAEQMAGYFGGSAQ